ncbi:MAG: branched-chain amino acid ABC transporter permease [Desulfomicrobiaceae bacterium]|nr:branched-chain amino acid ABC transporter permease [Desulfomicrobiaceae bacterium]
MTEKDRRGHHTLNQRFGARTWGVLVAVFALAHALPWLFPSLVHNLIMILLFAIMGQGWNVLSGYAGQFSFGHALFFGLGAYTSSILFIQLGISPWLGLFAAIALAVVVGLFIGFLSFRYGLTGPFFALIMLAFAEIFHMLAMSWNAIGGAGGLLLPLRGSAPWLMQFRAKEPFFYLLLWLLAGSLLLVWKLEGSRWGLYFQAIRENEDAAEMLGIDSLRVKLRAMALSAGMTAVGGVIYAQYLLFIDPDSTFGTINSVEIMLRPIIGGPGTVLGPVLGSLVLTPLSQITRNAFQSYSGAYLMFYGAILVAVVLFLPDGLVGLARRVMARRKGGQR